MVAHRKSTTEVKELKAPYAVGQFAHLVQIHPESVRRAIRQGRIQAVKIGPSWRIPHAEAERIVTCGLPLGALQ